MEELNHHEPIPQSPVLPINIPSHISPPSHQLSGHMFNREKNKLGVLKDGKTSHLLKPLMDVRGPREYNFYRTIWYTSEYKTLQSFIPRFYGLTTIDQTKFMELEDVTNGLVNPSNMDIKIGLITYDPNADYEKIKRETAKSPCSAILGFRICGMRIYNPRSNDWVIVDKNMSRQLVPSTVGDMLDLFLGAQHLDSSDRVQLIDLFLSKLRNLRDWFTVDNVHKLNFFSSSLLFVYSSHESCVKARLKMIDFAHVYPNARNNSNQPLDVNYLFGLDKLIEYFTFFRNSLLTKSF